MSLRTDPQNTRKLFSRNKIVDAEVTIRPFAQQDAAHVRELFITVNRLLSPPDLRDAFEVCISSMRWWKKSIVYRRITASEMAVFGLPSRATKWSAHPA
jgi:hypothetical protein